MLFTTRVILIYCFQKSIIIIINTHINTLDEDLVHVEVDEGELDNSEYSTLLSKIILHLIVKYAN